MWSPCEDKLAYVAEEMYSKTEPFYVPRSPQGKPKENLWQVNILDVYRCIITEKILIKKILYAQIEYLDYLGQVTSLLATEIGRNSACVFLM